MIKVFFDSNIILDYISRRTPESVSLNLVRFVISNKIKGYLEARQLTDIYYSLRKYVPDENKRKDFISFLIDNFQILPTLGSTIKYALKMDMSDFEDACLYENFKINKLDYFVTNNLKDYMVDDGRVIEPKALDSLLNVICA